MSLTSSDGLGYKRPMLNHTAAALKLFNDSVSKIESECIRKWAISAHNMPLWMETCQKAVDNNRIDSDRMAAYMVCVAIGA